MCFQRKAGSLQPWVAREQVLEDMGAGSFLVLGRRAMGGKRGEAAVLEKSLVSDAELVMETVTDGPSVGKARQRVVQRLL